MDPSDLKTTSPSWSWKSLTLDARERRRISSSSSPLVSLAAMMPNRFASSGLGSMQRISLDLAFLGKVAHRLCIPWGMTELRMKTNT